MKLMSENEWVLAQHAMHALRVAVSGAEKKIGGEKEKLKIVTSQLQATRNAIDTIRDSIDYHVGARALVSEFDRLAQKSRSIINEMKIRDAYDGPKRSSMTTKQKVDYVTEHGEEEFAKLPN